MMGAYEGPVSLGGDSTTRYHIYYILTVQYEECTKIQKQSVTRFSNVALLQWTFRLYDIDGNGVLDPRETLQVVTDILALVRPSTSRQGVEVESSTWEIFEKVDLDRNGVLSQSEFLTSCLEHSQVRRFLLQSV